MVLGNHVVGRLNIRNQDVSVSNINAELLLQCLVDMDAGFNVDEASLVPPVGVERDGYALNQLLVTFHLSGSNRLSRACTHLMIRLAVSPG